MLLVKSSFHLVLLSLGLASHLCAQSLDDRGALDDGWLQDNEVEPHVKSWSGWGASDKAWLQGNDVEPSRLRAADGFKALVKALFRYKKLKTVKNQASESVTKRKDVSELTKTHPVPGLLMVPDTTSIRSVDSPAVHAHHDYNVHHVIENDKSHRFTHSIRFGYGAPHGSLL